MEILKTAECFPLDAEEPIFTIVILQQNDQICIARYNGRSASKTDINAERLEDIAKLDKTEFQPQYLELFTRAEPNNQHYTKRPDLLSYYPITSTNKTRVANQVLQEVQVYELFKRQPHPNVAEYHGCEVTNGKISGNMLQATHAIAATTTEPRASE